MHLLKYLTGPWEVVRAHLITDLETIEAAFNASGVQGLVNLTKIKASKLLGRRNTSDGPVEEISLGSGLTMTGTTLSVNPATIPAGSVNPTGLQSKRGKTGPRGRTIVGPPGLQGTPGVIGVRGLRGRAARRPSPIVGAAGPQGAPGLIIRGRKGETGRSRGQLAATASAFTGVLGTGFGGTGGDVSWVSVAFDSANFTADGSMTWTVDSGDQSTFKYSILGKTMFLAVVLEATTVGGTLSSQLQIKVPASKTIKGTAWFVYQTVDNGTGRASICKATDADTKILCFADMLGSNWAAATNNTSIRLFAAFEFN
jgi:hypothetical protein